MKNTYRLIHQTALMAVVGCIGFLIGLHHSESPKHEGGDGESVVITVDYPDKDGRSRRTLRPVHTKRMGESLNNSSQAPRTDPSRTWIVNYGAYGKPGWKSVVMEESCQP